MNYPNPHQPGNHGPGGHAAPPRKKRKVWPWVVGAILLVMILGFAGCAALVGGAVNAVDQANAPVTLRYELAGEGTATTVTYSNASGTAQESEVTLPWQAEVPFDQGLGAIGSLTGQRGADEGDLTCRIVNAGTGAVIAESTSSGQYAVVSCVGSPSAP